jgi:L-asparaginase
MSQRLLLLYTGGTIGMQQTANGLAPSPGHLPRMIERLAADYGQLDVVEYPELIDSSAVTLAHWNQMINDIATHYDDYDGFVVVHGTDTMAYTASVLAFALQGLGKPLVLTGSQLPLGHAGSDGWNNLADALAAASQPDLHEVVIAFDRVLLRGCRARKVDAGRFHGFDSPNCPPLAEFGIAAHWHRERWLPGSGRLQPQPLDLQARVAAFFLTPGMGAGLIGQTLATAQLDGAVLMSYGNGNTPDDAHLLDGVRAATAAGTLVLNVTQAQCGAVAPGAYAASQPLCLAGALPGADMTPEAALAKLTWLAALGLPLVERRGLLACSLVGEMTL